MTANADDLPPLGEGELLAGKYRVERVLGVGGMGVVVAATHVTLGQKVALKFLRKSAARDEDSVERFLREARAVVRLKSQHAVRVQDVGTLEGGEPYMVMELLDGCDFATLLEERGKIPPGEAVSYVLQACEALAEAHAAGVIHRDLKPENLFMTTGVDHSALVKVVDFGLVKDLHPRAEASEKSLTGALVMGTPGYMSPEQIKASPDIDARADIWSVGVVLYELVSGRMPFEGDTLPDLIASIVRDPPLSLSEIAPEVPTGLSEVIARCLEKDPAKRYPKISKLAAALDPFASGTSVAGARLDLVQPSHAPPPTPPIAWRPATASGAKDKANVITDAQTMGEIAVPPSPPESKRLLWVFLAVGGVGFVALVYVLQRSPALPDKSALVPIAPTEPTASVAAPAPSEAGTIVSIPSATSNVPSSSGRSVEVSPSSTSKSSSQPKTKGPGGKRDAGADEGRLLDTR